MVMKNRLKDFMTYKLLNAAEFADRIGVQRSNVSHILNGRNNPGAQFIEKLLNAFPELDAGWLLTGHGAMLKEPVSAKVNLHEQKPLTSGEGDGTIKFPAKKKESHPALAEKIEKIVVFYCDKTFREYHPE